MLRLDELEEITNTVNDSNGQWWPFVFLRPRPDQRLTTLRVALLALLYGGFVGTLGNLLLLLLGKRMHPAALPVAAIAGCFVLYRFIFALCWNRRATRMQRREQNRRYWHRPW
jgi:hypothetical protein